ncbi:hypothetical protein KKE48_03885, partial [Patescibacteria group bacterium]|nr:hypothetical protein [Patescibacteria group bacterium]
MGKDRLNFSPELNLYGLNNPGIPFLTKEEEPVISDLAMKKLMGKTGMVERNRFPDRPISNLVYHQSESGEWHNGSWIMDIDGFDTGAFDLLQQPRSALVHFLELDEALAQMSGCRQMAEIGFNVGGGEIVFKRILLPENYCQPDDWQVETMVYQGTKMPDVFVEAWDKLKVGDYDQDWDLRVKEQLAGNRRDMDKRVVYQMINGEKWVEWNGVKMWAGLLSDKRDIERYLVEEAALTTLKPGEFLAAKYSHGGGGAISAATSQERETDKPVIVGDVQMMGENGEIYQAATEGDADRIDDLIGGLVAQLHRDHNLFMPETAVPLQPWLAGVPVLPVETYPGKFLLETSPVNPIINQSVFPATMVTNDVFQFTAPEADSSDYPTFSVFDFDDENDGVNWGDGGDNHPGGNGGGGDYGPDDSNSDDNNDPGGGGLALDEQATRVPTRLDLEGIEDKPVIIFEAPHTAVDEETPARMFLEGYLEGDKSQEEFTDKDFETPKNVEDIEGTKQQLKVTVVNDRRCFPETPTRLDLEGLEDKEKSNKKVVFSADNRKTAALKISRVAVELRRDSKEIPIYEIKWPSLKPIKDIPEWVWQG